LHPGVKKKMRIPPKISISASHAPCIAAGIDLNLTETLKGESSLNPI